MAEVKIKNIFDNKNILSPSNYTIIDIKSPKKEYLRKLVNRIDKGNEIGSNNYVERSSYKFIRTAAFTDYKFSIVEDDNSVLSISSSVYENMNLKEEDILICKDSNVGEVVILDKDYHNYMFSAGINKLTLNRDKFYIYGVMKNNKFKEQLKSKIPKGATIMHAKDLYLDCIIPYPTDSSIIDYVESLVKIIINKEKELGNKFKKIENIITNEINNNCNNNSMVFKYPKISQLLTINRLDTGNYTEEFSDIDNKIKNYKNGCFFISTENISGGNTPKQRFIEKNDDLKFNWIVPSYIYEDGTIDLTYKINCSKNNINQNCMLIINRTSKGGYGEYVGISSYYDYNLKGKAQHNQGIYKVKNMDDNILILMTCLLNSKIYRKYCANLSMGSKMKELKLNNILSIPFPKFPEEKINIICNLYYNKLEKNKIQSEKFVEDNRKWDKSAGILDLFDSVQNAKKILNLTIDKIYSNEDIDKQFLIF